MPAIPVPPTIESTDATGKKTLAGPIALPVGTPDDPAITFGPTKFGWIFDSNPALGSGAHVWIGAQIRRQLMIWASGVRLASKLEYAWSDTDGFANVPTTGLSLRRDQNNQLAQRNGLNAQSYVSYNTWTDPTNFERLNVGWSAGVAQITTQKGSAGGIAHDLALGADDTEVIRISPGAKLGFFGAAPVARALSASLVNNVASGGTDDVVDDFADGDWAALRSALYQTTRKLKEAHDALRAHGLLG